MRKWWHEEYPRCGNNKSWAVRRSKRKCSECRYEWRPRRLPLNLDNRVNHINGLEGFWSYLKRILVAKGGIREERLPYYLAEYVWQYNNRDFIHTNMAETTCYRKFEMRNNSVTG